MKEVIDMNDYTWDLYLRPKNEREKKMDEAESILRSIFGDQIVRVGDTIFLTEFMAWRGYSGFDLGLLVDQWNL